MRRRENASSSRHVVRNVQARVGKYPDFVQPAHWFQFGVGTDLLFVWPARRAFAACRLCCAIAFAGRARSLLGWKSGSGLHACRRRRFRFCRAIREYGGRTSEHRLRTRGRGARPASRNWRATRTPGADSSRSARARFRSVAHLGKHGETEEGSRLEATLRSCIRDGTDRSMVAEFSIESLVQSSPMLRKMNTFKLDIYRAACPIRVVAAPEMDFLLGSKLRTPW